MLFPFIYLLKILEQNLLKVKESESLIKTLRQRISGIAQGEGRHSTIWMRQNELTAWVASKENVSFTTNVKVRAVTFSLGASLILPCSVDFYNRDYAIAS